MPAVQPVPASLSSCVELGLASFCDATPPAAETCCNASINMADKCEPATRQVEVEEVSLQKFKR